LGRKAKLMDGFPYLFKPLKIKDDVIRNKIVFPPTVTGYSDADGPIGDRQKSYYRMILTV
jgi:2,4-dienoyl-CoA reductase-like NADH-dependent reductase (Old Yellow Enzyme family)